MKVLRRTPLTHAGFAKPPFTGYTDKWGEKALDAPKNWPFGRKRFVKSKAQPRVRKKSHEDLD